MPPTFDQIKDFDWLPELEEKILVKHGVTRGEVEECFFERRYRVRRVEDNKYQLFSRSQDGRYLFVIFAWKGRNILLISARDMTQKERTAYRHK